MENTLPPGGRGISADVIWGKNMKRQREKGENVKEKGENVKEKGRKGKENEKRRSKGVKYLQKREELRQKGHNSSRKMTCRKSQVNSRGTFMYFLSFF